MVGKGYIVSLSSGGSTLGQQRLCLSGELEKVKQSIMLPLETQIPYFRGNGTISKQNTSLLTRCSQILSIKSNEVRARKPENPEGLMPRSRMKHSTIHDQRQKNTSYR